MERINNNTYKKISINIHKNNNNSLKIINNNDTYKK